MNAPRWMMRAAAAAGLLFALAAPAAHAGPVLQSGIDNGVLTANAYTLSHPTHTANASFLDVYLFALGTDWAVNDVTKVFNRNGGIRNLSVSLYRVGQAAAIASDNTATIVNSGLGETWSYDFAVGFLSAGNYRLEVSGIKIGTEYTGTFTLSPADESLRPLATTLLDATVPEPGSVALLLAALLAMAAVRTRGLARIRR